VAEVPVNVPVAVPQADVVAEPEGALNTGQIWGIVLGSLAGALIIAAAIFLIVRRVRQRNSFESVVCKLTQSRLLLANTCILGCAYGLCET
jgi:nitrate reductase gamma subunit